MNFQTVGDDFETLLQCADAELQKNTAIAGVESGEYSIFLHATTLNIWVCAWNRTLVITQGRVVLLFEMDSSSCFGPRLLYGMQ